MKKIVLYVVLLAVCSVVHGQGFLPPVSKSTGPVVATPARGPFAVGEEIPSSLTVLDRQSQSRSLLSYKAFLEVLVVGFMSPRCDTKSADWLKFRLLDERFKDWRVAFLAVNTATPDMLAKLETTLKRERISWPVVQDPHQLATEALAISGTPEIVIIDESGVLRYRGPIDKTPAALSAVISHVDPVTKPEPPLEGACPL